MPIVNIVGDHATYHTQYDAQLQSDIETVARNVSSWVRTSQSTAGADARDAAEAIAAADGPPGQVATLILPADVSWGEGGPAPPPAPPSPPVASAEVARSGSRRRCAATARPRSCSGAGRCASAGLVAAGRIAAATGVEAPGRDISRAAGARRGASRRRALAYLAELASVQLAGLKHLILVDAKAPVSFFAYPGKKSYLVPDGCEVHELAAPEDDVPGSLEALVAVAGGRARQPTVRQPSRPERPTGPLTADKVCQAIAAVLPERRDHLRRSRRPRAVRSPPSPPAPRGTTC